MQSAITAQIQKVQASVDTLYSRVDKLENDLSATAEQTRLYHTSLSSSGSSTGIDTDHDESGKRRKRRVAPDISVRDISLKYACMSILGTTFFQNSIRAIHNNLAEEKQLKTSETYVC